MIVERYSYDVFGEPNRESALNNPYFFTGRRLDTETDNYYYRARYYNPEIGRFLQTDPIGYAGGLNLYTYCGNDPINWIDPLGLHISYILPMPMLRVPVDPIKWALSNKDEKYEKITDEDLLEAMVSAYNTWLKGVSRWSGPAVTIHLMKRFDTDRFYNFTSPSTRFIYNGEVYTAEQLNYLGVGLGFRHFRIFLESNTVRYWVTEWWNKFDATDGEHFFAKYGFDYYDLVRFIVEGKGRDYGPPRRLNPPGW